MPNHIQTSVEISGDKEKLAKLIKDTKIKLDTAAEDNEFDFNGIVPMPPELQITSGSTTDLGKMAFSQEEYDKGIQPKTEWWSERYPGVTDAASLKKFLEASDTPSDQDALKEGEQAIKNKQKYGYETWYEWSNANWGTKWNAYDVQYIAHDDTHLVLTITTAWDTPREIWDKLEEMGFSVNGVCYGEMDGSENIGNGGPFYVNLDVEYAGYFS